MSLIEQNPYRADFPELTQKIRGKSLVYLDSAASALKPWPVIEKIGHFYTYGAANIHRGAHYLGDKATSDYERTRELVRQLLNAQNTEEIIFTSGTTDSINLVAATWGEENIKENDEILLTEMEHHANIVPWQMLAKRKKALIKYIPVTPQGELDLTLMDRLITARTKILSFTHCSNTLGTYNEAATIVKLAKDKGLVVAIDGAQAVSTIPVDVQKLNCDFYSFSAHKLFGPYGVGVLFGKKELLGKLPPYRGGGSMIATVSFAGTTFNELPYKFEAGTPNISGVIGLAPAIEYVQKIGFKQIHEIEKELLDYATASLKEIEGVSIFGTARNKAPIISMNLQGAHSSDVAQILDQEAIAVRAGHHCTMPLLDKFKLKGTVRASFSIFNNKKDVDSLVSGIRKAKDLLL
jgi:cysteine desulfurase/selenocysteine lyase